MAVSAIVWITLNRPRFFESGEGAVLLDSFQAFDGNIYNNSLVQFGHEDAAALEIRLTTDFSGRVKLGGAGAVGIPPADLRTLSGDFADSRHNHSMLTLRL